MAQIGEDFQTLADGLMTFAVLDVNDETDAAGVVLVAGVVESFRGGQAGHAHGHSSITAADRFPAETDFPVHEWGVGIVIILQNWKVGYYRPHDSSRNCSEGQYRRP
jgi:hypothetical protein